MNNYIIRRVPLYFLSAVVALSFNVSKSYANNLVINKFSVVAMDSTTSTITFKCDVSWDNGWRSTINHDAVWIFLKYSTDAGVAWNHASMSANGVNPAGFSAPAGHEIVVSSDKKGFFLQRTDTGTGNVSMQEIQFTWNYALDGLSSEVAMAANTINKIFGIEMVYIPEGSFYAGDGNSSSDYRFKEGSADNDPWYIQNENAFSTTNTASNGFYYQGSGATGENNSGDTFLIPTSFPKGYQDFYYMKYELTEGQWVSFFNTLSTAARTARDITGSAQGGKNSDSVVTRNTVAWNDVIPLEAASTTRPDRPVSYISWPDFLAYADWAGLRPVSELEFEKAARGKDVFPVPNGYAWGKTTFTPTVASEIYPNSDEDGTEQIFNGAANINSNSLSWSSGDGRVGGTAQGQTGPLRVGIFAESSTGRTTGGAGFYGNLELSGNLYEMVVSLGRIQGRQFQGTHGDGQLTTLSGYEGNATNFDWPGISSVDTVRGVVGTIGSGYRGGDFQSSNNRLFQTSTRTLATKDSDSHGYSQRYDATFGVFQGGRLGRTAPNF